MSTPIHEIDDEDHAYSDTPSVWPLLLATGSVVLGYLVGRVSYHRDLRAALRQIEESSEPVEITLRTL
jgi:hypothetical protein